MQSSRKPRQCSVVCGRERASVRPVSYLTYCHFSQVEPTHCLHPCGILKPSPSQFLFYFIDITHEHCIKVFTDGFVTFPQYILVEPIHIVYTLMLCLSLGLPSVSPYHQIMHESSNYGVSYFPADQNSSKLS